MELMELLQELASTLVLRTGGTMAVSNAISTLIDIIYSNLSEPLSGTRQTNQRAELTAIQRALEIAPRNRSVTIYTDSNYSIKCVTEWFVKWKANGWLNAARKPVENKDLIEKILNLIEQRKNMSQEISNKVEFVWVKGHATNEGNIAADELAVAGAREAREILANPDIEEP